MSAIERVGTPNKHHERPRTPNKHVERPQTPTRGADKSHGSVTNLHDMYIKNPPNNLGLADPTEQSRLYDLVGVEGTEAIADPPSEKDLERVRKMAADLEARKKH